MILVTGAAGKTGRTVIKSLVKHDQPIRALVRRREQIQLSKDSGAGQIIVGDMQSGPDMEKAFIDVRAVYHIPPNMSPHEIQIGHTVIQAAKKAGIEHFVYHSVLHPQTEAMPHHWMKMRVEEKVLESGLPFTILQPAPYMQNILGYWQEIMERGVYKVPYSIKAPLSCVDLYDVGEAAAVFLTELGHQNAVYELCGEAMLTPAGMARTISQCIGQEVVAEALPIEAWEKSARENGMDDDRIGMLKKMFVYYDQYGLPGNAYVLNCLLGRHPSKFTAFVERVAAGNQC